MTGFDYLGPNEWDRLSRKGAVRFALFCVNQYKTHWENNSDAVKAVKVVKQWLRGEVYTKQCRDMLKAFRISATRRSIRAYNLIIYALNVCIDHNPTESIRYSEYFVNNEDIMKAQNKYYKELISSKENVSKRKTKPVSEKELEELSYKDQARFSLFCCNYVKYQWKNNKESVEAIRLAELWLEDKIASNVCLEFANSLHYGIMHDGVHDLIYAIADGKDFSVFTNMGFNSERFNKAQRKYFNELRYVDDIFEKIVLEGNV